MGMGDAWSGAPVASTHLRVRRPCSFSAPVGHSVRRARRGQKARATRRTSSAAALASRRSARGGAAGEHSVSR